MDLYKKLKVFPGCIQMLVCLLMQVLPVAAKVIPAPCFSDNMVLQQQSQAALWGTGDPGSMLHIQASWSSREYKLLIPASGRWQTKISTPKAGGPYTLSFDDGEQLLLKNILIGEVWICSGQSNMEFPLAGWGMVQNSTAEIASADYPQIRLLQVKRATANTETDSFSVRNKGWETCSPASIAEFSAVAYFFGRDLLLDKHIPIGLIHSSWGGTVAEAWTSAPSLKKMPEFRKAVSAVLKAGSAPKNTKADLEKWAAQVDALDSGMQQGQPLWVGSNVNSGSWKTMELPSFWESAGLPGFDGIVWFRRYITIPASQAGKDLELDLGPVDDNDITWFNGSIVGKTEGYTLKRSYKIPGKFVKEGENLIAVRITDTGGGGGIYGMAADMQLTGGGGFKVPLNGIWAYRVGFNFSHRPAPVLSENPNQPAVLFNAMIRPLIPFTIRGAIWYQGESNADRAWQYQTLFPLMIQDWRSHWGLGNFPFLFVQLANYKERLDKPAESDWAELREAQQKTLSLPNTGMAVTIDIGEGKDIHPKNKQDVGKRLALIARARVYGEKIEWSGPVYKKMKVLKGSLRVEFSHAQGLESKGAMTPEGFTVAGSDHVFHRARAEIKGTSILLSSTEVPEPVAIRYAWADNPLATLVNGAGLPASPFRTDQWTEITRN